MAAPAPQPRKDLSVDSLLANVRMAFGTMPDSRKAGSVEYTISDSLSFALAMFSLKCSSLLQFDSDMRADFVGRLTLITLWIFFYNHKELLRP